MNFKKISFTVLAVVMFIGTVIGAMANDEVITVKTEKASLWDNLFFKFAVSTIDTQHSFEKGTSLSGYYYWRPLKYSVNSLCNGYSVATSVYAVKGTEKISLFNSVLTGTYTKGTLYKNSFSGVSTTKLPNSWCGYTFQMSAKQDICYNNAWITDYDGLVSISSYVMSCPDVAPTCVASSKDVCIAADEGRNVWTEKTLTYIDSTTGKCKITHDLKTNCASGKKCYNGACITDVTAPTQGQTRCVNGYPNMMQTFINTQWVSSTCSEGKSCVGDKCEAAEIVIILPNGTATCDADATLCKDTEECIIGVCVEKTTPPDDDTCGELGSCPVDFEDSCVNNYKNICVDGCLTSTKVATCDTTNCKDVSADARIKCCTDAGYDTFSLMTSQCVNEDPDEKHWYRFMIDFWNWILNLFR